MNEWFVGALQIAQSVMLAISGFFMLDCLKTIRRGNTLVGKQQELMKEMMDHIRFQQGIIFALQAGAIGPWNLPSVDLSNLPVELRIKIWHALIDVSLELHHGEQSSDRRASVSEGH